MNIIWYIFFKKSKSTKWQECITSSQQFISLEETITSFSCLLPGNFKVIDTCKHLWKWWNIMQPLCTLILSFNIISWTCKRGKYFFFYLSEVHDWGLHDKRWTNKNNLYNGLNISFMWHRSLHKELKTQLILINLANRALIIQIFLGFSVPLKIRMFLTFWVEVNTSLTCFRKEG